MQEQEPLYAGETPMHSPACLCGARTRTGQTCRAPAMPNGRCRMHGGLTPRGSALPQFKHGRYSRLLPARLVARYGTALADPDLLALREEIALTDARIADLLGRLDTGESGALWGQLQKAVADIQQARTSRDSGRLIEAVGRIQTLTQSGQSDTQAWRDVSEVIERRRRLVDSETRRLVLARRVVPVEEVVTLLGVVLDVMQRHVPDPKARAAITAEIQRLLEHRA